MNKNNFFLLPLVFSFFAFFVTLYVCTEDNIYYWDYAGYYNLFLNFGELCQKNFSEFVHCVIVSIQNDDYNVSSVLLPISFYSFFGGNRISFIFSLFFFYLMPLSYIIYYLTSKLSSDADAFVSIFFTLFYSPFLCMLFVGYTDLSCIALLCAASYIVVKNKNENIQIRWMLFVGFLLFLCFMFRRGYAYCLISFYATLLLYNIIFYRYKFKKFVFGFAVASLTTLVCIIVFQFPLVVRIIHTNYTYQYSAWSQGSWVKNIFSAYDNLPPSLWVIFIFSIFFLLYKKQKEVVFFVLFIILYSSIYSMMMNLWGHHFTPIGFCVLVVILFAIHVLISNLKFNNSYVNVSFRLVIFGILAFVFMYNYRYTFYEGNGNHFFVQNVKCYRLRHQNIKELTRLKYDIDNLPDINKKKIAVFASNVVLNDAMLKTFGVPAQYFIEAHQIDRRDGIPIRPLFTGYVVVTRPTQLHADPNLQYVIRVPNEMILGGFGVGAAYSLYSGPYKLARDVDAFIYTKNRAFTEKEVKQYFDSFPSDAIHWNGAITDSQKKQLSSDCLIFN